MNRAFSAETIDIAHVPGALPQARIDTAPLARQTPSRTGLTLECCSRPAVSGRRRTAATQRRDYTALLRRAHVGVRFHVAALFLDHAPQLAFHRLEGVVNGLVQRLVRAVVHLP